MRDTRRTLFRHLALAVVLALWAAAWGGDDDAGAAAPATEKRGAAAVEPGPGFDGNTIRLGVITPLSGGPAARVGNSVTNGNRLYFDHVNNELGGVAGKYRVELVAEDNRLDPALTVEAYDQIKNDVVMIAQILSTPPTKAVLPQLKQDQIVASTADFDSDFLREQNILTIGAPYEIQAINAMSYWQKHGGKGQSACVAYRDDPYFKAGLKGVKFAAREMGFKVSKAVVFEEGTPEFSPLISQLQGCKMVYLASSAAETGRILGSAVRAGFAPQWIGQSPTWTNLFAASPLVSYMQDHFWVVAEGPEWGDESVPGMAQMLGHIGQYAPEQQPDTFFALGYAEARAVHQVLEKAVRMGDLSRRGIIEAMNSIHTLKFGGLLGNYEYGPPKDRNPPRGSTIFEVDPDAPGALSALSKVNFVSDAAKSYQFKP